MSGAADFRWVRVPRQALDGLQSGEWSFAALGLAVYLAGRVNHLSGEAHLGLRTISDEAAWPWSLEKLRRDLHGLAANGVIEFEPAAGKKVHRIRFLADGFGIRNLQNETPLVVEVAGKPPQPEASSVEVTSNVSPAATTANPLPDRVCTSTEPPPGANPQLQHKYQPQKKSWSGLVRKLATTLAPAGEAKPDRIGPDIEISRPSVGDGLVYAKEFPHA